MNMITNEYSSRPEASSTRPIPSDQTSEILFDEKQLTLLPSWHRRKGPWWIDFHCAVVKNEFDYGYELIFSTYGYYMVNYNLRWLLIINFLLW